MERERKEANPNDNRVCTPSKLQDCNIFNGSVGYSSTYTLEATVYTYIRMYGRVTATVTATDYTHMYIRTYG